jgi:TonB family protein
MIKVTLIVTAGLVLSALGRRRSAAWRHMVLSSVLLAAAIVPALERVAPAWELPGGWLTTTAPAALAMPDPVVPESPGTNVPAPVAAAVDGRLPPVSQLAQAIWTSGAVLSLALLGIGLARLRWLARRSRPLVEGPWPSEAAHVAEQYGIGRQVRLLLSDHPTLLVTWGAFRPAVLLPAGALDWPDDRRRVVLAHELSHIRRGDWLAQMLAEVLRSIYWFNPLVWMAARRLRLESERACDDEVLRSGVGAPTYASHLLDLVRAARHHRRRSVLFGYPAPAMARPSSFERRITSMLNEHVDRQRPSRRIRVITNVAMLSVALTVAGLAVAAQSFATLSGSVRDPMNQTIPKVTLILVNEQTEAKHEVRSDATGRFEFVGLPAGSYLLQARYPGFTEFRGRLTVGTQNVERNLSLAVGSVRETITVAGDRTSPDEPVSPVRATPRAPRSADSTCTASSGGEIRPPMKILDVRPRYAQYLRAAGIAGTVQLSARIQSDGSVAELKEVGGPAHAGLTDAAMEAVRQWRFTGTLLNCTPVDVAMNVTVTFNLR